MCETYLQVQYTCTITWSNCKYDVPAEWVFTKDQTGLRERVEKRWQVIKGDDALVVSNFSIVDIRLDVNTSKNQIGA